MIINYGSHFIDENDINSVVKVLKSKNLTQGSYVEKFENDLKKYFGFRYCKVLSNGTAALHLAIKSLKIKKNCKVLTSPLTFIASASSILMNDLRPEFVDINDIDYTMDLNKTEDALKKNKDIKAIIGIDYAGHPCDWQSLNFLKKKYKVWLINDNCHAMGAKINNSTQYGSKYCDIITQSYHAVKNITTGEGGSILTNNRGIDDRIKKLRNHGMVRSEKISKKFGSWRYTVDQYGFNYRLTDIQCALGISQLKKLNTFVNKRKAIASYYNDKFKNNNFFCTPKVKKNISHAYHIYPLLINFKLLKIDKKTFFREMLKRKIKLQVHYTPLYLQKFLKKFNFDKKDYPVTEDFYKREVSIPIFYDLKKQIQDSIINKLTSVISRYVK
jgi:UDP-4-amino-4,6-dideoxy-L-N-acetyl-beta-L-altrosamine transaminase